MMMIMMMMSSRPALNYVYERRHHFNLFTHDCPIILAEFRRLATMYFAGRQVGHKSGNTRNRGFQQRCETS